MNTLLLLFSVFGGILLVYILKKIRLRYALLSALSGIAAFFAADFVCSFLELHLSLNVFSLTVSALGGIPGVILLHLLTALFR